MASREVLEEHVRNSYLAIDGRLPQTDREAIEFLKRRRGGSGSVYGRGMYKLTPAEQDNFERRVREYLYLVSQGCAV